MVTKRLLAFDTYFKYWEELLPGSALFIHVCCLPAGRQVLVVGQNPGRVELITDINPIVKKVALAKTKAAQDKHPSKHRRMPSLAYLKITSK